ncbi:hypothetical protein J6590_060513 [Homalodisca vitripennis]|nr:hypothetical protein J6590_060513 [Homalodisca vitripennis]
MGLFCEPTHATHTQSRAYFLERLTNASAKRLASPRGQDSAVYSGLVCVHQIITIASMDIRSTSRSLRLPKANNR